jgi:hypothetical protein
MTDIARVERYAETDLAAEMPVRPVNSNDEVEIGNQEAIANNSNNSLIEYRSSNFSACEFFNDNPEENEILENI